jgi:hypothetical protein
MQARNTLFIVSPLIRQAIITSGALCASGDALANRLAALCEQFYLNRQIEPLTEAAELLASLPSPHARAAGNFYSAMVSFRQGDLARTARLLEATIRTEGAGKYKARAIQSLGIIYRRNADDKHASHLYHYAMRLATRGPQPDFVTIIRAGINLADILGCAGDHRASLEHLRAIRPAIEIAARVAPVYAPLWCNEVALDLAGLGRIEEARRFTALAVSSPFARAYPEWLETAQEIEQQAREKAARNRILRPALQQARKTSPKSKLRLVKKPCPVALPASTRRRTGPVAIIRPEPPRSRPTLEQICLTVRIRAPSF